MSTKPLEKSQPFHDNSSTSTKKDLKRKSPDEFAKEDAAEVLGSFSCIVSFESLSSKIDLMQNKIKEQQKQILEKIDGLDSRLVVLESAIAEKNKSVATTDTVFKKQVKPKKERTIPKPSLERSISEPTKTTLVAPSALNVQHQAQTTYSFAANIQATNSGMQSAPQPSVSAMLLQHILNNRFNQTQAQLGQSFSFQPSGPTSPYAGAYTSMNSAVPANNNWLQPLSLPQQPQVNQSTFIEKSRVFSGEAKHWWDCYLKDYLPVNLQNCKQSLTSAFLLDPNNSEAIQQQFILKSFGLLT